MRVYAIEVAEGYEFIQTVDEDKSALLDELIDGTPRGTGWTPPSVRLITKGERKRSLRRSDAPWLCRNILVVRPEAAEILKPLLTMHGELLPLSCDQATLFAFNAYQVLDALNETASLVERFDDGRIWWINEFVFHRAVIGNQAIFKITSLQPSPLFVGDEFIAQWRAGKLEGMDFRLVWEG